MCLLSLFYAKRLKMSNISFFDCPYYNIMRGQHFDPNYQQQNISNRTPTSLVLSHTTYIYGFKPGCPMSHSWLQTPACRVQMKYRRRTCDANFRKRSAANHSSAASNEKLIWIIWQPGLGADSAKSLLPRSNTQEVQSSMPLYI